MFSAANMTKLETRLALLLPKTNWMINCTRANQLKLISNKNEHFNSLYEVGRLSLISIVRVSHSKVVLNELPSINTSASLTNYRLSNLQESNR